MAIQLNTIPQTTEMLDVPRVTAYRLIAVGDLESCDVAPSTSRRSKTPVSDDAISTFIQARTRHKRHRRAA